METVRIRVEDSAGGGYVVRLLAGADGAPANSDPSASIAADLDAASAPPTLGGGAMDEAVPKFVKANPESTEFAAIGKYLGDLLLQGQVAQRWDALKQQHPEGLCTLLNIQADDLHAIPWELAVRGQRRLFLDETAVFARMLNLRPDAAQELVPLRLLVVEGPQDDETDELGTASEVQGIKTALPAFRGRIDAVFLKAPSQPELLHTLARVRPHVLHFMGHGMLAAGNEPALRVGDWSMTGQFVRDFLTPMPRVAVLNACRTGEAARGGALSAENVRGLTDAFLSSGAAAAIGMQGDVRGSAAGLFGAGLYGALGEGRLIDQAVAAARRSMALGGANNQARDWCLPSLTLSVQREQVLPLECRISGDDLKDVEDKLFTPIRLFVDRAEIRWELVDAADPDDRPPQQLVRIVGDGEAGKTWLVNWIRTRCALRGRRVRYVDFKEMGNLDFVRTLEVIRDTKEDLPSREAATANAFARFTFDLAYLVNGKIPPEQPAGEAPPMPDRLQLGGENELKVFESFRAALEAATAADPLLLIFDHVDSVLKTDFQTRIVRHLIVPLAGAQPPNVRLIVVLSNDQLRSHWPSDVGELGTTIKVKWFESGDFEACAEDVVLAMGKELSKYKAFIEQLTSVWEPPISPKELRTLAGIVGR